ncbi:hypothetical protein [Paludisphaera mucosa]|uniref:DUF551 domain-containing protein n=1 Tax=Paludisphaera mucosa TaxID=3030827 RepID=A0ABT6FED2_9BACT|nr:hypothetical protein [Paludisphaera mucosa]MDG3005932.1 hypothetical protein [Paludisphaera mucosa]
MAITLNHRTTKDAVDKLLAEGFKAGPRGDVWVSKYLDSMGEMGRHLLELNLELNEDELEAFWIDASIEIMNEDKEWVKCPFDGLDTLHWYEIPPELVNESATVRAVSHEEVAEIACEMGCD